MAALGGGSVRRTWQRPLLCHGDLGSMELHFAAGLLDGMSARRQSTVSKIASMVAQHRDKPRASMRAQPGMVVPGLMNGLAGIGLGLMRSVNSGLPMCFA